MKRAPRIRRGIICLGLAAALFFPALPAFADLNITTPTPRITKDPSPLALSIERTDADKRANEVYVGDVLTWTIKYTNTTNTPGWAYPRSSNMSKTAVEGNVGNCRYGPMKGAHKSGACPFPTYTVTLADMVKGSFTPSVSFDWTEDRNGTKILKSGIKLVGPTLTVKNVPRPVLPDDSDIPRTRPVGEPTILATGGKKGFNCYRIPALTTTKNGWILAAWDGRPFDCEDAPQENSIIQRISKDGGKSWGPAVEIAKGLKGKQKHQLPERHGYSDPSYVTDRKTGEVFAFFVKSFHKGFIYSKPGIDPRDKNVLQAAVISSKDNGLTWSAPRIITSDITLEPATWRSRFATSGQGIQLQYGPHKGRLIQQYSVMIDKDGKSVVSAVSVYSDDHGKTWKAGNPVGVGMDESKVVELSDGTVMVNSRSGYFGADLVKARKITTSTDGGLNYGAVHVDTNLPDPNNNASIIRAFPQAPKGSKRAKMLLFSNANSESARVNGTVRVSYDDGKTWTVKKVFEPGAMQYSVLTALPDAHGNLDSGRYGLLYEHPDKGISYMTISLKWLGAKIPPAPSPTPKPTPTVKPQPTVKASPTITASATQVAASSQNKPIETEKSATKTQTHPTKLAKTGLSSLIIGTTAFLLAAIGLGISLVARRP